MSNEINELLSALSPSEYETTMKILKEVSDNGTSNILSAVYDADYDEIPVSIDEFIESDDYAGWFTNNGKGVYPYWRERLREIFDGDPDKYNEIVYTGCLAGDTLIALTNNRSISIRELANTNNISDHVFSYDTDNKQYTIGHLINAFSTGIKDTYTIYTEYYGSIRATSNHQFLDSNGEWVSIDNGKLKPGCHLMNDIAITNIEYYGKEEVYDLTVDTYHNFMLCNGIIAHNSIGSGKSHIAVLSLAYHLYSVMCLSDPYKYFNLAKGSKMYIVFFNTTLALSQGVAYTKFQALLQNSPWFLRHGHLTGNKYIEYIPDKDIVFSTGSQMEHSLGKDIIGALMDEINFTKGEDPQMEKSKIMTTYSSILERIRSRFTIYGRVRGKLFLVSSKKSEFSFLENYIKKQIGKPGVYVADAVLFKVKPSGTYCGKMFKVAVGGSNLPSKIIQDNEDPVAYERQGYNIEEVPIEFKNTFELDMDTSLMNILGISVSGVMKFFTYNIVSQCYNKNAVNPFVSNIISTGMNDDLKIQDFLDLSKVDSTLVSKPIFIHLDASLTGDRTGLSAVAAVGYRYQDSYDAIEAETVTTKELIYRHVFSIGIQCPNNSEISFAKTRNFIYFLKNILHWNIKGVSTDGFQSSDCRQALITMGFENVDLVSLDRTPNGYLCLKSAVVEKRITLLYIPELETEFIQLERNNVTGKCDHPIDGSKDILDSLAGAVYNLSLHEQELAIDLPEIMSDLIIDTNDVSKTDKSLLDSLTTITKSSNITDDNIIDNSISYEDAVHDYIQSMSRNSNLCAPKLLHKEYEDTLKDRNESHVSDEDRVRAAIAHAKAMQNGMSSNSLSREDRDNMIDSDSNMIIF